MLLSLGARFPPLSRMLRAPLRYPHRGIDGGTAPKIRMLGKGDCSAPCQSHQPLSILRQRLWRHRVGNTLGRRVTPGAVGAAASLTSHPPALTMWLYRRGDLHDEVGPFPRVNRTRLVAPSASPTPLLAPDTRDQHPSSRITTQYSSRRPPTHARQVARAQPCMAFAGLPGRLTGTVRQVRAGPSQRANFSASNAHGGRAPDEHRSGASRRGLRRSHAPRNCMRRKAFENRRPRWCGDVADITGVT
jgi:hypothetical protein